jgi:heptaprenylglyceryl phosphate synthase
MRFKRDNQGTITLIEPLDEPAKVWLEATAPTDAIFLGGSLAVEHRFVNDVVLAIEESGGTIT